MTSSTTSSHGVSTLDHVHVGPRRHDVRDDGVAQLDDAFDHFAGVFFEQAFAMAFADDRADFLFDGFLVGLVRTCGRRGGARSASTPRAPTPAAGPAVPMTPQTGQRGVQKSPAAMRAIDHGSHTVE